MKNLISFNKFIKIILTFLFITYYVSAEKRLCGDIRCETILSQGIAVSNYNPSSSQLLPLRINSKVRIYSKPAESGKNDLWYIETQGRRGFVPKRFIREMDIYVKKDAVVQVEFQGVNNNLLVNENNEPNQPELKSSEPLSQETTTTAPLNANEIPKDIVKETDIKNKPEENVQSTVVQQPIDATALPSESKTNNIEDNEDDAGVDVADEEEDDNENNDDEGEDDYEEDSYEDEEDTDQINRKNILAAEIEKNKETSKENLNASENKNDVDSQEQKHKKEIINDNGKIPDNNKEKTETVTSENSQKTDNMNENSDGKKLEILAEDNLQKLNENFDKTNEQKNDQPDITNPINNPNEGTKSDIDEVTPNLDGVNINGNELLVDSQAKEKQDPEIESKLEKNYEGTNNVEAQNQNDENNLIQDASHNKEIPQPVEKVDVVPTDISENETNHIETIDKNLDNENNASDIVQQQEADLPLQNNQDQILDVNQQTIPNLSDNFQKVNLQEHNIDESNNLKHNHNHDHNHNNHHHHDHDHHHHHHHHGLPLFFNRVQLPAINAQELELKETIDSDKLVNNNILNIQTDSSNLQTHDLTNEEHYNSDIINNETDNNLNLQLYNQNSEGKEEEDLHARVVTPPGYEENNYVDNPVETITFNPVLQDNRDPIIQENSNLIEPEIQHNQFHNEIDYNNHHKSEIESNKVETDPVTPLPLTQNTVQDEASESLVEENSADYGMSALIESFNSWTGLAFDTLKSFWSISTEKEDIIKVEFEQSVNPNLEEPSHSNENNFQYLQQEGLADEYCEKIGPNDNCPGKGRDMINRAPLSTSSSFTESDFFTSMSDKILEMFDMLVLLSIAAISSVFFAFGYYCICNSRKENLLINKLNIVERSLLAANKEVSILKQDLQDSRSKLTSIEDSSYCTNDLVVNLEKELDEKQQENRILNEQISILEQEVEKAVITSVELKKIIAEHEIVVSNLEQLQKKENEQQDIIEEINQKLTEKTLENSNLHILLSDQSVKFEAEIRELQNKIEDLEDEKLLIQSKFDENEKTIKENLQVELNTKIEEMEKLESELQSIKTTYEDINRKWQSSESKIESLKECMRNMNKESWADIDDLIESVDIKADNLLLEKENSTLKEQLEGERDARKLLDDHVKIISEEVATLKKEHNQAEKDKLEAQTRLDVLSNYFKEKEAQLQKDLTLKEALWMKQQGETTSTVEKIRALQDEVQALKSQNESLHAEIEAQGVTHKAQLATLENRNHETWLLSKQSERKYEEARSEATMLRRKLTTLVSSGSTNGNQSGGSNNNSTNDINRLQNSIVDGIGSANINNVPSPIHLETPNSPALIPAGLPPPPPFLPPPPFMPPLPGPFMGMPTPFVLPPGGRPPPLGGRLMSPPPAPHRRGRYSPSLIDDDDDDYDDYDYDDDRSQRRGGNGRNNRSYSPENGRYSPDSRYNYTTDVMSQYDTETDFSPQVSPREESFLRGRRGGNINRDIRQNDRSTPLERTNSSTSKSGFKPLSPSPKKHNSNSTDNRSNKSSKGKLSSSSEKSFDSRISKGKARV